MFLIEFLKEKKVYEIILVSDKNIFSLQLNKLNCQNCVVDVFSISTKKVKRREPFLIKIFSAKK